MSNAPIYSNANWITIPITQAGTWVGGTITWNPGTTVPPQQIDLDLAVPVEKKKVSDGCTCKKCREFYPYAEANQEDGSMVCYGCRMTW